MGEPSIPEGRAPTVMQPGVIIVNSISGRQGPARRRPLVEMYEELLSGRNGAHNDPDRRGCCEIEAELDTVCIMEQHWPAIDPKGTKLPWCVPFRGAPHVQSENAVGRRRGRELRSGAPDRSRSSGEHRGPHRSPVRRV